MPPPLLFDTSSLDFERVLFTRAQIYQILPHRYEFMQLDAIVYLDIIAGDAVAYRDIREDEFWVRGHIPGRPIFPGVLMTETAGHLASFLASQCVDYGGRFVGFGGLDQVKFREAVQPNCRVVVLAKLLEAKPRRVICATQALVDGRMVFEGEITGMLF